MAFRYEAASGGYNVMDGQTFLGRVSRSRSAYHHSNGRTYRSWSWAAHSPLNGHSSYQHPTRTAAAKILKTIERWEPQTQNPPPSS